jgi:hypothetical protein
MKMERLGIGVRLFNWVLAFYLIVPFEFKWDSVYDDFGVDNVL